MSYCLKCPFNPEPEKATTGTPAPGTPQVGTPCRGRAVGELRLPPPQRICLWPGRCSHRHKPVNAPGRASQHMKISRMTKYYFSRKINLYPEPPKNTCLQCNVATIISTSGSHFETQSSWQYLTKSCLPAKLCTLVTHAK